MSAGYRFDNRWNTQQKGRIDRALDRVELQPLPPGLCMAAARRLALYVAQGAGISASIRDVRAEWAGTPGVSCTDATLRDFVRTVVPR